MQLTNRPPYLLLSVDARGWVDGVKDDVHLKTPTGFLPDEVQFADPPLDSRQAPQRLQAGYRLTKMVDEAVEIVPWKYCKVVDREVVELTESEKATKDAEIAQEEADKQEAEAENAYDVQDAGILLKAFAIELKAATPQITLPTKQAVLAKFKELKGW